MKLRKHPPFTHGAMRVTCSQNDLFYKDLTPDISRKFLESLPWFTRQFDSDLFDIFCISYAYGPDGLLYSRTRSLRSSVVYRWGVINPASKPLCLDFEAIPFVHAWHPCHVSEP